MGVFVHMCMCVCFDTTPIETSESNQTSHLGLMSNSRPIIDQGSTGLELFSDWLRAAQALRPSRLNTVDMAIHLFRGNTELLYYNQECHGILSNKQDDCLCSELMTILFSCPPVTKIID